MVAGSQNGVNEIH